MKPLFPDTSAEAELILIEGLRRTPVWRKLQQVQELNQLAEQFALATLRRQYPQADPHELKLRLASRWLTPEQMQAAFGWSVE